MNIRNALLASHVEAFFVPQDLGSVAEGLLLPPKVWDFLMAMEGHHTARDMAERTDMPVSVCLALLRRLETMGLVARSRMPFPGKLSVPAHSDAPLSETSAKSGRISFSFAKKLSPTAAPALTAEALAPIEATSDSTAPADSTHAERSEPSSAAQVSESAVPHAEAAPSNSAAPIKLSLRLAARTPRKSAIQVSLRRAQPGLSPATAGSAVSGQAALQVLEGKGVQPTGLRLETIMRTLLRRTAGDRMQAQLLAYRVFLRVPTQLLEKAGIRSVFLINDKHVLTDPELLQSLRSAVREVTGLTLDETAQSPRAA